MTDPRKPRRAAIVTRPYGGVTAEERRAERQRRLLTAGLSVFGAQGFYRSTVRDICAEAGLTERYFYESYKTLLQLFDAVFLAQAAALHEVLDAARQATPAQSHRLAQTEAALRAWLTFLKDDPRRARILLVDALSIQEIGNGLEEGVDQPFTARLHELITLLHPDLALLGVHPHLIVSGVMGSLIYMTKNWVHSGYVLPLDDILRHTMLVFRALDDLYRDLQAEAGRA